jgi:hypothetical protein
MRSSRLMVCASSRCESWSCRLAVLTIAGHGVSERTAAASPGLAGRSCGTGRNGLQVNGLRLTFSSHCSETTDDELAG